LLAVPVSAQQRRLRLGDPAPALRIAKWLKGQPVDVTRDDSKAIYIVEFWATWCPPCRASIPHMSMLQDHFKDKGVTVVSITAESEEEVRTKLKHFRINLDRAMRFSVALDRDGETSEAYLDAMGIQGIPAAFIVRGGRLLWKGHPFELDDELIRLTGDKSWAEVKAKHREHERKKDGIVLRANAAMQNQKWDEALAALEEVSKFDPSDYDALAQKYYIALVKKRDTKAAAEFGAKFLSTAEDAELLDAVAFSILADEEFAPVRDRKLALALAEKAAAISRSRDPAILATLARAKHENGRNAEAVKIAEQALEICADADMRQELEEGLKRYRAEKQDAGS
jgi:thiol-disulfide isomerase/thioredoxin